MQNPKPAPEYSNDAAARLTAHDIAAFVAQSVHWSGKGARLLARAVAAALDSALQPAVVCVSLELPQGDAPVAVDGRAAALLEPEKWRRLLQPWLGVDAARVGQIAVPGAPAGRWTLIVAPIGGGAGGHIALFGDTRDFPGERERLLLDVAAHQAALALGAGRTRSGSETPEPPVSTNAGRKVSRARLQLMADTIPALISYVDREGVYRFVNRRYEEWFGLPPEALIGRRITEVFPEIHARIRAAVERALDGERASYEAHIEHPHCGRRFLLGNYVPDFDADGAVRGFFALVQDITARKTAEQLLQDSEDRYRRLLALMPAAVYMCDADGRITYFNRRAAEIWGREPTLQDTEERFYSACRLWQDGRLLPYAETPMARALSDGEPARDQEVTIERADGTRVTVAVNIDPVRAEDGARIAGAVHVFQDITDRKRLGEERAQALQAEREARAEAELLRDLGAELNSRLELDALLRRVTEAVTATIGARFGAFFYKREETYTLCAYAGAARQVCADPAPSYPPPAFHAVFRDGGIVRCDDIVREPLGGKLPCLDASPGDPAARSYLAVPVKSRGGEIIGGMFFGHGEPGRFNSRHERVAAAIAAQAAVALDNAKLFDAASAQARRILATYDQAPVGIAEAGAGGRFLRVNDRFCAITGYSREELLALRFSDITHPEDVATSEAEFARLLGGKIDSYSVEKRYLRKDGDIVWVRLTVSSVREAQGRIGYSIGVIEDITERRCAEIVIAGQKRALEQMVRGEPLAVVLETLVDTFDRQSTARACAGVLLLQRETKRLHAVASGRLPPEWVETVSETPVGADSGWCAAAAASGESVFVEDLGRDGRFGPWREMALRLGFRAAWSLCLRGSDGRILGTFPVLFREPRAPSAEALRLAELLADTVAVAIERHESERALRLQARVLSRIHDAVVVFDPAGHVLQWNEGASRLFGYTPEETIGRHLSALYAAAEDYRWLEEHVVNPLKRDGRLERIIRMRRRSGEPLHVLMSLSLLRDEGGAPSAAVAYMLDVTERVQAERELAAHVRQQEAVARLGQLALSDTDLQALMDQTVRLVAATLDVEFCKVLELQPDGETFLLRAGVGWRGEAVCGALVDAGTDSQSGFTLRSREPVVVADLRAETRFRGSALLREHDVVSGMSVVIGGGDRPYGVLGAHTARLRRFSDYDVNFMQSVAHALSSAIDRGGFERALAAARDELERRVEERTAELARANQSLRDEMVERMGVEAALRESEAQYRMLFERNPLPAWVFDIHTRHILAANETAVWQYGYTREEFLRMNIHDLHPAEEATRALDYAEQFPPETAYIGVWKHRKQDETVIDVEVFVYEVLFQGRWARLMLANDITERRRAEREFRLLETITRSVSEASDLDAALYGILRQICETTGWALGEAWLPAADNGYMRCSRAWYCAGEGLEEFRYATWELELRRGEGPIGRAWDTGQPVWVPDVAEDATFRRASAARAAGLRAAVAFPVLAEGGVVALLAFFLRDTRLEDEHQVKLVATIATQAGLAIQRKRAEERLRESEESFRLLVEGAHDYAIYMLDAAGRIVSWNKGAERMKGYTADEVIGRTTSLFYSPEDAACELPQRYLEQARTDGVCEGEGWRLRKNGERFWATFTITALTDAQGLRGFVKVTRDVTERKRAEERLKESEARLARAQEFSLLMVAHVGLDGRWLKVPQMLCATLAYREEELLARRIKDVTHPDDYAPEWGECERLIRGEAKSFDLEKRFLRRDGRVIWVYQNTSIVLDDEDRPLHFLTFIRDVTQRREAEEQLRRSRIQLSEAQRLAHLGSWEWDVASGRIEWSDELYRIYGVPRETPMTYDVYLSHVHPEDRSRAREAIAAALESRQPFTLEERITRPDGEIRHLLSHGAVVAGPRGEVVRLVGVCLDITERKRAEQRLREYAHRLEGLSQRLLEAQETERRRIARELHDQIGQDLSVIKINLQALKRLPGASALDAHLDETVRIVEGVLATARNLSVELRPSVLDDLGLVAALRWYLDRQVQRAGVALHFVVDSFDLRLAPTIETACFRLAQEALTNILRHADASHVNVTLRTDGEEMEMRITDDGKGFDVEAARARASQGESFGLLGMEERALLAGGRLEIVSAPGQGATVLARFPLIQRTVHNS